MCFPWKATAIHLVLFLHLHMRFRRNWHKSVNFIKSLEALKWNLCILHMHSLFPVQWKMLQVLLIFLSFWIHDIYSWQEHFQSLNINYSLVREATWLTTDGASFVKFFTLICHFYTAQARLCNVNQSILELMWHVQEWEEKWQRTKGMCHEETRNWDEFYKSKASKCCQELTSKYKNWISVGDFGLYKNTASQIFWGKIQFLVPLTSIVMPWDPKPFGYQLQHFPFCVSLKNESHWNDIKPISDLKIQEFNHQIILFNCSKCNI